MNNLSQKKIILENSPVRRMPYENPEYVQYEYEYDNDARIDAQSLNNTFQQLVDNDLYLENRINAAVSYHAGPKSPSEAEVKAGYDGYKFWQYSVEGDPIVYRKEEIPVQDLLSAMNPDFGVTSCNMIFENDGIYYIGTDQLMLSSETGYSGWNTAFSPGRYWKYMSNGNIAVVMAGGKACSLNNVYDGGRNRTGQTLDEICEFGNPTAAALRPDGKFFIASGNSLSSADAKDGRIENIVHECDIETGCVINDICFFDGDTVALATSNGLYTSDRANALTNASVIESDAHVNDIAQFNNNLYFATQSGLFKLVNGSMQAVGNTAGQTVPHVETSAGKLYFCIDSEDLDINGIYELGSSGNPLRIRAFSSRIKDFRIYDGMFIIQLSNGLYYLTENDRMHEIKDGDGNAIQAGTISKLRLSPLDSAGHATLYSINQISDSVRLHVFSLNGTSLKADTSYSSKSSCSRHTDLNGETIQNKTVFLTEHIGKMLAVTTSGIYDFSDLAHAVKSISNINFADVSGDRLVIAAGANVYLYKLDDLTATASGFNSEFNVKSAYVFNDTLLAVGDSCFQAFKIENGTDPGLKRMHAKRVVANFKHAVPSENGIYVLKTDGSVDLYSIDTDRLDHVETDALNEGISAVCVNHLEVIGLSVENPPEPSDDDSASEGETTSYFDILALNNDGLHVEKLRQAGDENFETELCSVLPGSFNLVYLDQYKPDNLWLASGNNLSAYLNKDILFTEDPFKFTMSAEVVQITGTAHVNCVEKCQFQNVDDVYVAGTDSSLCVMRLNRNAGDAAPAAGSQVFSDGTLAYVDSAENRLVVDYGTGMVSVEVSAGTGLLYGFELENPDPASSRRRIFIGTTDNKSYVYDSENAQTFSPALVEITYKSGSTKKNMACGAVVYDEKTNQAVVLLVETNGTIYKCLQDAALSQFGLNPGTPINIACSSIASKSGKDPEIFVEYPADSDSDIIASVKTLYKNATSETSAGKIVSFNITGITATACTTTTVQEMNLLKRILNDAYIEGGYTFFSDGATGISCIKNEAGSVAQKISDGRFINDGIIIDSDKTMYVPAVSSNGTETGACLTEIGKLDIDAVSDVSKLQALHGTVAFMYDGKLYKFNPDYITSVKTISRAGGVTAAAFFEKTNTLFIGSNGKILYGNVSDPTAFDISDLTGQVDMQAGGINQIVVQDNIVIAVAARRRAEFTFDGRSWICCISEVFSGEQVLNGILQKNQIFNFDDEYMWPSGLDSVYISESGVLNGSTDNLVSTVKTSGVFTGVSRLKYFDETPLLVKTNGISAVVADGSVKQIQLPDGFQTDLDDIIVNSLTRDRAQMSGYVRQNGKWSYLHDTIHEITLNFDIRSGIYKSSDMHIVATDDGVYKIGYLKYKTLGDGLYFDEKQIDRADFVDAYEYQTAQDLLVTVEQSGQLGYRTYSRSLKQMQTSVQTRDASVWLYQDSRMARTGLRAVYSKDALTLNDSQKALTDITDAVSRYGFTPYSAYMFRKINNLYYLFFDGEGVLSFNGFREGIYFEPVDEIAARRFESVQSVDGNLILVPTDSGPAGIYVYDVDNGFGYQTYYGGIVDEFYSYMENGSRIYLISNGNSILSSDNLRVWSNFVDLDESVGRTTGIYKFGRNQYIFVTDSGIYAGMYQYSAVKDTYMMTEQDAWDIYDKNAAGVNTGLTAAIDAHVGAEHAVSSNATAFGNLATVEFDIDIDKNIRSAADIENQTFDYVKRVYTGSNDKDFPQIFARVKNSLTNNAWKSVDCNWIVRPYYSGVTDLDICLHTTKSYYIPHIEGAGNVNCEDFTISSTRPNLAGGDVDLTQCDSTISSNYTTIEIGVLSNVFNIDDVMQVSIQGNSLPKKVYIDTNSPSRAADGPASDMYSSFAEPSIADGDDVLAPRFENEYRLFRFYCFGTDQQAVRMTVYDGQRNYEKELYKIILYGKGATTETGDAQVYQTLLTGQSVQLRPAGVFANSRKLFIGWSKSDYSGSQPPANLIADGASVDTVMIDRLSTDKTLKLYAVWYDLQFDIDSTVITVNSNGSRFQIANVEVDPTAVPELGSKLAIKIED